MSVTLIPAEKIHEIVRERYGQLAEALEPTATVASCCSPSATTSTAASCCGTADVDTTSFFADLYQADDWTSLPADVTALSLGCGDPVAIAELQAGQTVLDLGSGGGIDCFLAARQVGANGRVIGVDMTPAMLAKAEKNKAKLGLTNVEFRHGQIEALPVEDDSVDVIISNCVVNLSPDKPAVLREAWRVLKPGGRLAISDMVTEGEFTAEQKEDMASWSGCIAGAESIAFMVETMRQIGFSHISVRDKNDPEVELADTPSIPLTGTRLLSARLTAVK
jgi:arsenite methyltransferase